MERRGPQPKNPSIFFEGASFLRDLITDIDPDEIAKIQAKRAARKERLKCGLERTMTNVTFGRVNRTK
jgi:hypothetical protein